MTIMFSATTKRGNDMQVQGSSYTDGLMVVKLWPGTRMEAAEPRQIFLEIGETTSGYLASKGAQGLSH